MWSESQAVRVIAEPRLEVTTQRRPDPIPSDGPSADLFGTGYTHTLLSGMEGKEQDAVPGGRRDTPAAPHSALAGSTVCEAKGRTLPTLQPAGTVTPA